MRRFFRPVILYHYVVWEYLKAFGLALTACTLVMLLSILWMRAAEMEDFGVSTEQMVPLAIYFIPYTLTYALPLAAMIAAIMVFGRLAAENEILAAQCGGAAIGMLAAPVVFCGVVFSVVSLWCNDQGLGWGFSTIREEVLNVSKPKVLERLTRPGQTLTWRMDSGATVHINILPEVRVAGSDEPQRPIHIAYFDQGQFRQSLYARHHTRKLLDPERVGGIVTQKLELTLVDGQVLDRGGPFATRISLRRFTDKLIHAIPLPTITEGQLSLGRSSGTVSLFENYDRARKIRAGANQRRELVLEQALGLGAQAVAGSRADPASPLLAASSWAETQRALDLADSARSKIRKQMVEFHRKLALSLMPLSMVFLGIGLGLLVRKGHRLVGFVLGILSYFLIYYPQMILAKELANLYVIPPAGVWLPNVTVIALGVGVLIAHERGYLGAGPPAWLRFEWAGPVWRRLARLTLAWSGARLEQSRLMFFRRRADRHVAGQFVAPLVTLALAVAVLYVGLDLSEHGGEVVTGVAKAGEPVSPDLPVRSAGAAVVDVLEYYAIRALGMVFDLMPAMLLISGVLTVTIMVRNNEHLIFKSSGTPLQRAFLPLVLLAAGLSLGVSAVREFVMPSLIMERDRLKPLVYHRSSKSKSIAGMAADEPAGRPEALAGLIPGNPGEPLPVIYEIAKYTHSLLTCENVRIYLPGVSATGRLVRIEADRAVWDADHARWNLQTAVRWRPGAPGEPKRGDTRYEDHGYLFLPEAVAGDPQDDPARFVCTPVATWSGQITPAFLESKDLGPSVMRMEELWSTRERPEYCSELWRRGSEWLTGFLLLMVTIPFLVRQGASSALVGVAWCIVYGAVYVGLTLAVSGAAGQATHTPLGDVPPYAPLFPHLAFVGLGIWRYGYRMET